MSTRAIRAGLLLLFAAGASGCAPCAKVYRVAGSADPKTAYNVLFMGSGFGKADLPAYRQAVQEYAEKVLATGTFSPYQAAVNVYRIDLTSGPIDRSRCPPNVCAGGRIGSGGASTPLGTPVASTTSTRDTLELELRARQCWTASASEEGQCRVVWLDPEGQARALDSRSALPTSQPWSWSPISTPCPEEDERTAIRRAWV
jgi:hypothetical protein